MIDSRLSISSMSYEKKSDITSVKALENIFKDDNHGNNENEFRHKNQIEKKSHFIDQMYPN